MGLSVEVLDLVFGFLRPHRESLIACSKVPVLSPIVERHLYHHLIVRIRKKSVDSNRDGALDPEHLSELISENHRILNHVRILQIEPDFSARPRQSILQRLDGFANTLRMFPMLESIMFVCKDRVWYDWSADAFRAALEDRLGLPTLKEVHLVGGKRFPFQLLGACKHVKHLALSGSFTVHRRFFDSTLPQLTSLSLFTERFPPSLLAWLRVNISQLQSLKCAFSSVEVLPELLRVCSETLTKLEMDLTDSGDYTDYTDYTSQNGEIDTNPWLELPLVPPNLQQLTIRTAMHVCQSIGHGTPKCLVSSLPAAATIIGQFIASPHQHLTLDIDINLSTFSDHSIINWSPLTVLGPASLSIPRINLYVHAGKHRPITRAQLRPLLEDYEDILRALNMGVLVVHPGKPAPALDVVEI